MLKVNKNNITSIIFFFDANITSIMLTIMNEKCIPNIIYRNKIVSAKFTEYNV